MNEKFRILFEKYNFDFIYINPQDSKHINFEYLPEEILVDFKGKPNYLGTVKINNTNIEVFYNKNISLGHVIFKYKDIKKERRIKLDIIHNSVD